ncbi:hypothetical protein CLU79DRAFT_762127 [Phycomyces nitens]|nr:hypothetical protein CLU79DRAFT_762127 [Phycomyces nitens]
MVSFQCDGCSDVVKKPKLNQHGQRCRATFTCIDCSTTFAGYDYQSHTSCITEAEKYQKALYKGKKAVPQKAAVAKPVSLVEQLKQKKAESEKPVEESKKRKSLEDSKDAKKQKSTEWSSTEFSSDMAENMELALKHVLKEKPLSFNDARKKVMELIENHPKSSLTKPEKKDLKKNFDRSLLVTFENNTLTLKRK